MNKDNQPEGESAASRDDSAQRITRLRRLLRSRPMKKFGIALGVLVGTALLLGLLAGVILDGMISRRVVEGVNAHPGHHLAIGDVSINAFTATITLDDINLLVDRTGAAPGVDSLRVTAERVEFDGVSRLKLLFGGGFVADEVVLHSPRIEIHRGFAVDTLAQQDTSRLEDNLETGLLGSFAQMLPERISPLLIDRVEIRDGLLFRSRRYSERVVRDSISSFTLIVVDLNSDPDGSTPDRPGYYSSIEASARGIVLHIARGANSITVDSLRVSSADSTLDLHDFRIDPALPPQLFFDSVAGRRSRFVVRLPEGHLHSLRFHRLWYGEIVGHDLDLDRLSIDVLVDKRYEPNPALPRPRLPNEFLAMIAPVIRIDTVHLRRASVYYGELHPDVTDTARVDFTDATVDIAGIDTKRPSTERGTFISGSAQIFNAGRLHLMMDLPLASNEPIYYEGWLDPMNAAAFNSFLVPAERTRIIGGRVERVTFTVRVEGGRAHGEVTPLYSGLGVELLEAPGAGTPGIEGWLKRMAAQDFAVIPANPLPGDTVRIGRVDQGRDMDQAFMGFLFTALRSGLREVVGF